MNVKQKTLAALLVLGIGMSGCNTNDNNLPSQIVNKNTDENKTEGNRTIPTPPVENNESNGTVPGIIPTPPVENNESNGTGPEIIPVPPKQMLKDKDPNKILKEIGEQHGTGESNITIGDLDTLKEKTTIVNINNNYVNIYRSYIASADTTFSSPATVAQVQSMINEVNALNLPEHAIVDRSFFKKTNGKFEHRFVYLPVENTTTGRKWLNNNLGADYANVDSSDYNPSQQATTSTDHLAYGSMFQWGRKADGHELMDWTDATTGTGKYGETDTKNDDPSDSLFIKQSDWRVNPDDTLWASESSANNVCPVGYRLPLAPDAVVDAENELAVELNSWDSKDADGSMSSDLKLPMAGIRRINGNRSYASRYGVYWTGSVVPSDGNNSTVSNARDVYFGYALGLIDTSGRGYGYSVRCIKDQTPAERSATILKMIGNDHNNNKSTVTVAQLKAILPALENINDDYQDIYRSYIASADKSFTSPATSVEVQKMITDINDFITKNSSSPTLTDIATQHSNGSSNITIGELNATSILGNALPSNEKWYQGYIASADTHFSSPATLLEVQRMINEVNSFNIPAGAVLDKNFFKKTRGKFEHRFVYLPVTNPTTGKTWLNNNLGAWYANVGRNMYDPSQQATNANDNYAKGSLFQWGRKADGHEIVGWWYNNGTIAQLAKTTTKSDNPTDGKFIAVGGDWRVHPDDDLWKGIDAPNNPCPAHYRVPTKEDLDTEAQTWDSLSSDGSMSSLLKIPGPGWLGTNGYTMYYPGGEPRLWYASGGFAWTPKRIDPTQRTDGQPVRCIKN